MNNLKLKKLMFGFRQIGGRTKKGSITCPRRGALVQQSYRFLDFKRTSVTPHYGALILNPYIYCPFRSGYISQILLPNGMLTHILATEMPITQTRIFNLKKPKILKDKGWSNFALLLPLGSIINNIELTPNRGGQIARSAGNFATILAKKIKREHKRVIIKLKSGEHRAIDFNCVATVGIVSNRLHFTHKDKTAGATRRRGIRPRVRPSAMNAVDHPMGGRTKGGCAPQSKQGAINGKPTSSKKAHSLILIGARKVRLKKKGKIK
jgi:large subunit ribosomal protein L2